MRSFIDIMSPSATATDGTLGIECERFLVGIGSGVIEVGADHALALLDNTYHSNELGNCQLECMTAPHRSIDDLLADLAQRRAEADVVAARFGQRLGCIPAAPVSMPQDVFPSDDSRRIQMKMGTERYAAAIRTGSIQLNIGSSTLENMLDRYNRLAETWEELRQLGDHTDGARDRLYRVTVPDPTPPVYDSPEALWRAYERRGLLGCESDCYDYIRMKPGGLIEIRCWDAVEDLGTIRLQIEEALRIAG